MRSALDVFHQPQTWQIETCLIMSEYARIRVFFKEPLLLCPRGNPTQFASRDRLRKFLFGNHVVMLSTC